MQSNLHFSYILEHLINCVMMSNILKCKCGLKDIIRLKHNESIEQHIQRKRCPKCGTIGLWKQLSQDEYMWEKASH